jgi:hypothetical protein
VGAIKGLLAEAHYSDHATFYGRRFNGNPGDDFEKRPSAATSPYVTGFYQGQLSLWVATFEVHPDNVGTTTEQHHYTFVFQANGNQLVANSDHWSGASVQDHPDFAYYPTERVQENPGLDYNLANQLDLQAR